VIADGPPRRVLQAIRDGHAELILPRPALQELTRVLRVKLRLEDETVSSIAALVEGLATVIADPPAEVAPLSGDPDDDRIIAAALAGGAETLVSGDRKHVLALGHVKTMRIIRPQGLLQNIAD
jgi:uncharacterized protein